MLHGPSQLTSLINPFGNGNRRVVVIGTDKVGENTDVMFTVQLKDGVTQLTQVPRDTFVESAEFGVIKANALYAFGGMGVL
ncbi:MAG: LCP family protein, partial [Cyanobium sp. MAG_137]|nr:LCP family protein [Cyanobium sp. MAG_137]